MKTLVIGHRGYSKKYTENTKKSFLKALEVGADGIELDVHLTKDGKVVVFHDFELARIADKPGYIFNHTLKEIRGFKIGENQSIPTLAEVIDDLVAFKNNNSREKIYLNVEFKAGSQMYEGIEAKVMEICYNRLSASEVIFSSFDHHCLLKIKALDKKAKIGVLTTASLVDPWSYVNSIDGDYYHPHYLTLSQKNLKEMMFRDLLINAYTVNDVSVAKNLMATGIHMIITDDVETMVALRNEVSNEA